MFATIQSAVVHGAAGRPVAVEVHVAKGLPSLSIVGLPNETVREARDRVRAAVMSAGITWPDQRITISLVPSEQPKSGSGLDLAIAVGVLAAIGEISAERAGQLAFIGELGLDGSIRPVAGVAPMVGVVGARDVVVSPPSVVEARVAALGAVRSVDSLRQLISVLDGDAPWPEPPVAATPPAPLPAPDLADVLGQPMARVALEIAAAGGHHTLFVGPPGAGKTMLASRLPGLLPPLERTRALEATMIHSAAGIGLPLGGLLTRPPFRAPHHTASAVALIGGGSGSLRPGEVSLAHGGVLFLDELAEFSPHVLDGLRQPLESGVVHISRAHVHADVPADFLLVAAMNPCPCGGGDQPGDCSCAPNRARKYASRLSGPLLDRFDVRLGVTRPRVDDLIDRTPGEPSSQVAARVAHVRRSSRARQGSLNRALPESELDRYAPLTAAATERLRDVMSRRQLSGRGLYSVRRVARTIADLRAAGSLLLGSPDATAPTGEADGIERIWPIGEDEIALALELRGALRSFSAAGSAA